MGSLNDVNRKLDSIVTESGDTVYCRAFEDMSIHLEGNFSVERLKNILAATDLNAEKKEAEKPCAYYLLVVSGGVEITLSGPYLSVRECTKAAIALDKAIDPTCDSLFYLILDHQGTLAAGSYSEGFFEQTEKEPARELVNRIESLRDHPDTDAWTARELGEIAALVTQVQESTDKS